MDQDVRLTNTIFGKIEECLLFIGLFYFSFLFCIFIHINCLKRNFEKKNYTNRNICSDNLILRHTKNGGFCCKTVTENINFHMFVFP